MKSIPLSLKLFYMLSLVLLAGLSYMCGSNDVSKAKDSHVNGNWELPYFGFNTKGMVDADQQTTYANDYFDKVISVDIKKNLVVRVTAGTYSQLTYEKDWTNDIIDNWVSLQKRQGVRFIYVVNGNDTPVNQAGIIKKWIDAGAKFDFIEMMNEYYLPKFARGDTDFKEVTEQITPEKYVDTILPEFWQELDQFKLPYYLILANFGNERNAEPYAHWNQVVTEAMKNKYHNRDLNATIHYYLRESDDISTYDYGHIDRMRELLPAGRHIAITEAGIINKTLDYEESGHLDIEHHLKLLEHLQPGDYLLDQILYNTSKNNNTASLNPNFNGETPKGELMLEFIRNRLQLP